MAKSSKKNYPIAVNILLVAVAGLLAVVAYKQIYLAGQLTGSLPKERLTKALERCFSTHTQPSMFKEQLAKASLNSSASGLVDWQNMFSDFSKLLNNLGGQVIKTQIQQNYITELKVLKIQDFTANTGEMRVQGRVEVLYQVPILGNEPGKKDYQTVVFKRGDEFYFNQLDVKKPESQQWDHWQCAQKLQ